MKEGTFYFPHDYNTRSDHKIKKLMVKHGMCGYGVFWAIVESLYNNANAMPTDYDSIAFDLHTDCDTVKSIINDFDLFVFNGETFGSLSIQRRIEEKNTKSDNARKSAFYRWNKTKDDAIAMPPHSDSNAIKESKVKESKVNNISKEEIDEIYKLYPTTCPNRNSSNGKSTKDKDKIKILLANVTFDKLKSTIERYVKDCKTSKTYMKNFSTFLNNLPDYDTTTLTVDISSQPKIRMVQYTIDGEFCTHREKAYNENLHSLGADRVKLIKYIEDGN